MLTVLGLALVLGGSFIAPSGDDLRVEELARRIRERSLTEVARTFRPPSQRASLRTGLARALAEDRPDAAVLFARVLALAHPTVESRILVAEAYERAQLRRWARFAYLRAAEQAERERSRPTSEELEERAAQVATEIKPRGPPLRGERSGRAGQALAVLDLAPGFCVADVGCGNGWLSAAAAAVVGPEGIVYAVEIQKKKLERVQERGIANIITVHSSESDVELPEESVDLLFLHDVATHVRPKKRPLFYASVAKALRPDGCLVIFGAHGKMTEQLGEIANYGFHPEPGQGIEGLEGKASDRRYWEGVRLFYRAPRRTF